jgi:selenocysteine-specific elongation factor
VLVRPGAWAPTRTLDVWVRPVRGRTRIPGRGAFTVHAGAAETAARLQLGAAEGEGTLARLRTTHAMVLEPGDRFVIREEGRAATVGGGVVLDVAPPRAFARRAHQGFLARRLAARDRATMASLLVEERGAVRADQVPVATGADAPSASVLGGWAVADHLSTSVAADLAAELGDFHLAHPLEEGMPLAVARGRVAGTLRAARVRPADDLIDALVDAAPGVVRTAVTVRLATHAVDLGTSGEDIARLLDAIGGDRMASPPGVGDLVADGFARELIDAASRADQVIRLAPDLVVHPALVDRARDVAAAHPEGLTVSALREALGTSRKFAVPLVEWMDAHGLTRREGDLRFLR